MSRRSKGIKHVLRLVGVALLIGLVWYVGPRRLLASLAGANPWWLLLGFALNLPQIGLKALRWMAIVRWQGIRFNYRQAILAYFSALLIGFLTPGRLGEMAKAFALRHETGTSLARSFSSVVLDRVFDLYLLVVLGLLGFAHFALIGSYLTGGRFALVCVIFLIPLLFLNERMAGRAGAVAAGLPLLRSRREWIVGKVEEFSGGLAAMTPGRILVSALLTASAYAFFFLQCYCCAWALHFSLPVVDLVLMLAVSNLIGFLPFSISNLGTREATLAMFFAKVLDPARPKSLAVAWGLSQFLVLFVGGGVIGFVCWQIAPMGMRRAVEEVKNEK